MSTHFEVQVHDKGWWLDVHLGVGGDQWLTITGDSPDPTIVIGPPHHPLIRIAPELVPTFVAALRILADGLEGRAS